MADSKLKLVIEAEDRATSILRSVGKSVNSVGKTIGTVAKVTAGAFAAVGAATAAFGVSSVKAYAEAEKEMAKFNATMATMGKKGEKARAELLKLADATVALGFDDEEAANSLAKFYKITENVETATRANNAAMDIARAKGIALSDASKVVGLALAGNVRALKEYQIELRDGASAVETLRAIEGVYAGQAKGYADTLQGTVAVLSSRWENLKERIGEVLVEALRPTFKAISDFLQSEQFSQWIDGIITKIKDWVASMGGAEGIKAKLVDLKNYLVNDVIPVLVTIWTTISTVTKYLWEHRDAIMALIIAYGILKVALAISSLVISITTAFAGLTVGAALLTAGLVALAAVGLVWVVTMIAKIIQENRKWKQTHNELIAAISDTNKALDGFQEKVGTLSTAKANEQLQASIDKARELNKEAQRLADLGFFGRVKEGFKGLFGKQFGGSVSMGEPYVVGEKRPEVFVPSQSGNIKQLDQVGAGKTVTVNFNNVSVRNDADLSYIVEAVKKTLGRENELTRMGAI